MIHTAKRVFIGVGHGGPDPGAVSGSFRESIINLTIALAVKEELERHGLTVGISRVKDEEDRLAEEIKECNAFNPDVAIEVHNNAGGGDGFEVYVQTNKQASKSRSLATSIEARVKATGQNSRGLKTKKNPNGTDYFGWLRQVECPTVLLEGFFVDGVKDRKDFDTSEEQRGLGVAYAHGILDYLNVPVKAAASTSKKRYVVQVGVFDNPTYAEALKRQLEAKGFPAIIKEVSK